MTGLQTKDPAALRMMFNETLFAIKEPTTDLSGQSDSDMTNKKPDFAFLGQNKSGFLFVVANDQYDYMSERALDAFKKTLSALQLSEDQIALVNITNDPESIRDCMEFFKPVKTVFLGLVPSDKSEIDLQKTLLTYSFEEMLTDIQMKKDFWVQIKNFFITS